MAHKFPVRVYYEDTDMAGIVYHANYLKYIERARSEWINELGIDQNAMREKDRVVFAVRRIEADYLAPAKFGDHLEVLTGTRAVTGARLILAQNIMRGPEMLFQAIVTVACLTETGHPARMPETIRRIVH